MVVSVTHETVQANIRWVRLGCHLLNALLQSSEGVKFLAEDDLLNQIVRSFAQLDPVSLAPITCHFCFLIHFKVQWSTDVGSDFFQETDERDVDIRLFRDAWYSEQAERRPRVSVHSIMATEDVLTPYSLLEKFKLFTAFYHLTELRSREDLLKGIIENLDYGQ